MFESFAAFEAKVVGATHTEHALEPETLAEVERRFSRYHAQNAGEFLAPQRVDVLRRTTRGPATHASG